jgi:hypothetical protein
MKLVGIEEKQGTYENRDYHNFVLHCTHPFDNGLGEGVEVSVFKVKEKVLSEALGKQITLKDIKVFIGNEVKCFYDKYRNVSYVVFSEASATQELPHNGNVITGF